MKRWVGGGRKGGRRESVRGCREEVGRKGGRKGEGQRKTETFQSPFNMQNLLSQTKPITTNNCMNQKLLCDLK